MCLGLWLLHRLELLLHCLGLLRLRWVVEPPAPCGPHLLLLRRRRRRRRGRGLLHHLLLLILVLRWRLAVLVEELVVVAAAVVGRPIHAACCLW
jgi:hypothetical protein